MSGVPAWVVLAWRLPAGLSTPRVTTWRNLQRLGAARLTPGAAVLPFREDLQEQLDWLAQDIEQQGGEAWVLPVTGLSESEERSVRERMAQNSRLVISVSAQIRGELRLSTGVPNVWLTISLARTP